MKMQLPASACLSTSACIVALLLPGCVQVTTTIGSLPASPVNVEVQAKENRAETNQPIDYAKIQKMIRLSIDSALSGAGGEVGRAGGAIDRPLDVSSSPIELIDIPYPTVGAGDGFDVK